MWTEATHGLKSNLIHFPMGPKIIASLCNCSGSVQPNVQMVMQTQV